LLPEVAFLVSGSSTHTARKGAGGGQESQRKGRFFSCKYPQFYPAIVIKMLIFLMEVVALGAFFHLMAGLLFHLLTPLKMEHYYTMSFCMRSD
jgi:hypothetical protein